MASKLAAATCRQTDRSFMDNGKVPEFSQSLTPHRAANSLGSQCHSEHQSVDDRDCAPCSVAEWNCVS